MKFAKSHIVAVAVVLAADAARAVNPARFATDRHANLLQKRQATVAASAHAAKEPKFLNEKTKPFKLNVTAGSIPEINFDLPESYAGLLPISDDKNETRKLYFWYTPTTGGEDAANDVTIWFNGGPGCSSLEGFFQENGPMSWQPGTIAPVLNPYSWANLTNMIWVEQPVGVGFTQGEPNITDETEMAEQFLGFFKNFVKTFDLQKKRIWVTGESYAGLYVPYVANAMHKKNDTDIYNVQGMWAIDPCLSEYSVQSDVVAYPFVEKWNGLFNLNETAMNSLKQAHNECGYQKVIDAGTKFPPHGKIDLPVIPKGKEDECQTWNSAYNATMQQNQCFNIYRITDQCPLLYDPLGFPGSTALPASETKIYFAREDVQRAINAPVGTNWTECTDKDVFVNGTDLSSPSTYEQIPQILDWSKRAIVSHGEHDYVLIDQGSVIALQNMTWAGKQGFQKKPSERLIIPYESQGDMGVHITERGLTWVQVKMSGHMMPEFQPMVGYRLLEYLLGRIEKL